MQQVDIILIGFGNVGKAFAQLLLKKQDDINSSEHVNLRLVGIITGRHGMAYNADGLPVKDCIRIAEAGGRLTQHHQGELCNDALAFIREYDADIVLETSPTNVENGQPAIDYLKAALEAGKHVVTANKGPVVHAFNEIRELAVSKGKVFAYESSVLDGAPLFAMLRNGFPGAKIHGFRGILNSCSNFILDNLRTGQSLEEAIEFAQMIGIAETDPLGDIDGWDSAIKLAALITVVMGIPTTPQEIEREGIGNISRQDIEQAEYEDKRWKLICKAEQNGDTVTASVKPEMVDANSPFFTVQGTNSFVLIHSDVLPGVGLLESDPGPQTTAYGLMADVLNIVKGKI
jgi:homoserine dehydrogenase